MDGREWIAAERVADLAKRHLGVDCDLAIVLAARVRLEVAEA